MHMGSRDIVWLDYCDTSLHQYDEPLCLPKTMLIIY